jgi:acyl-CoA synthetase (AMP-forming)/AMP-acid ligase II
MEQKIVDPKTGKEVKKGEHGELCVKGPNVMLGYLNRPKETAETIDKDGFLHTGDIGYLDSNDCLYIVDRLKELIKVKGLQVPPAELEDLLLSHPSIADCAVIGVPDPKTGETPKAFVVKRDIMLNEKEVYDYVASRMAPYKHLKGGVQFVESIPRSPAGKILRRELRDAEKAKSKI